MMSLVYLPEECKKNFTFVNQCIRYENLMNKRRRDRMRDIKKSDHECNRKVNYLSIIGAEINILVKMVLNI